MRIPRTKPVRREDTAAAAAGVPHFDIGETGGTAVAESPHGLERAVRRELLSQSGLRFSSLVVRRVPKGVCLEGVIEVNDESQDIGSLVRRVSGVDRVLNHLVMHCPATPPQKG